MNCKSCGARLNLNEPLCLYCGGENPQYFAKRGILNIESQKIDSFDERDSIEEKTYGFARKVDRDAYVNKEEVRDNVKVEMAKALALRIIEDFEPVFNNYSADPLDGTMVVKMYITVKKTANCKRE